MEGIIIKNESNNYTVKTKNNIYICKPRGKFRIKNITPLVGDNVEIDTTNNYIIDVKQRKNCLIRPQIANVDIALIVTSVKEPNFDSNLLDKLLTIVSYNNITPIICLTKLDLLTKKEHQDLEHIISYYRYIGYTVVENTDLKKLKKILANKTTVLSGQSGAGKSSLLNKLNSNLSLMTSPISKSLGRGKHTTRCVTLYNIDGALIADTPGFSSVDFRGMSTLDIRNNMMEIAKNQNKCKYRDCMHIKEDDCYIKKLVSEGKILESRYNNYKSFVGGK